MSQETVYQYMLKDIICALIQDQVKNNKKALFFNFNLKNGKKLSLLAWGNHGYVGIFTKELDFAENAVIDKDWKNYSYHDSCWRGDGVERVLNQYDEKLQSLDVFSKYRLIDTTDEQNKILLNIIKVKRGEK